MNSLMHKEDLSELHIVISYHMMWASKRIGLRCLAGIESMDGCIDFGMGAPRKSLTCRFLVAYLIIILGWAMERPFRGTIDQTRC